MSKILIVEDDDTLAKMYQKKLSYEGYETAIAYSGEEALEIATKVPPDLMLLDIMMPGMDGFTVLKNLRSDDKTKDLKVIILTNLGTSEVFVDEAKMLGALDYLVKYKTSTNQIVERIKKELENK